MTLIDIKKMTDVQMNLEMFVRRQRLSCAKLDQSYVCLENLSGMQQVRRTLEHIMEDIQEEAQLLSQMAKCVEQTCKTFTISEVYIAEHAEESRTASSQYNLFESVTVPEVVFKLLRREELEWELLT